MTITALLAIAPVLLVLVLLLRVGMSADRAALIALFFTLTAALLWCGTAPSVLARACLSGVIGSLPIVLVMYASMFQIVVMEEAGALRRLVAFIKSVAPGQRAVQVMLINVGFGILLSALGATTGSMFAPILLALGYSAFASIVLPSIGYEALCAYALLGVPIVVFSGLGGVSVQAAGLAIALFTPLMSVCICLGMLWLTGGVSMLKSGLLPALIAGLAAGFVPLLMSGGGLVTLTGLFAGLAVVLCLMAYLKISGRPLYDASSLDEQDQQAVRHISLAKAISPWIFLVCSSLLMNAQALPLFDWAFVRYAMPVELIPGAPERLRLFWQPWLWVALSTLCCAPLLRMAPARVGACVRLSFRKSLKPCLAAMLFFCLAYTMTHSGKSAAWAITDPSLNMIHALATVSAGLFGALYPFFAPFMGLMGGFIAGSQTSSFAMFTGLHLAASESIGASGLLVAASSGAGGGLASVLSPAKVLLAAAAIGRADLVPEIIRKSLLLILLITILLGVMTMLVVY